MISLDIRKIAHFFTLILVILLIWASKGFLKSYPLISAPILMLFTILYLVIAIRFKSRFFIYPSIVLFTLAYFLTSYYINPYFYQAPLLSVTLVGIFLLSALKLKKTHLLFSPLIQSIYVLIVTFTLFIIYHINHYTLTDQIVAVITLTFFSSFIWLLNIKKGKQRFKYWSLITISLAFLFLLFSLTYIPAWHYSLYLMAFFVCMMHLGTLVHRKKDYKQAKPFYWVGFVGLGIAPLYSIHHTNILLFLQAALALHFWEIHLEIKKIEPDCQKKGWICRILNIIVYPLTVISLALIVQQHFPISFNIIGTCLIFAFLYFKMAHEHRLVWKNANIILIILGTVFLTISYITALFLFLNPNDNPIACIASVPLVWILLFIGITYHKDNSNKIGLAIYKTQYLSMVVSLIFPLFLNKADMAILLVLDLSFLLTYMIMYMKDRWWGFFYSIPFSLSYLYYLFVVEASIPDAFISMSFLFPGIAATLMALWLHSKGSKWSELFYFWWYTLSAMALVSLNPSHMSVGYSLALWGLMYLMVATFAKTIEDRQRSCLMTAGHTTLFSAALLMAFLGNPTAALQVYMLIGIGYLISFLVKKKEFYLYPAAIAGSFSYYLYFLYGVRWDIAHIGAIPFLILVYTVWYLLDIKYHTNKGIALKRIGHLTALFYTIAMLLTNASEIHVGIAILSLCIYAAIYSLLISIHKGYDILFLGFGFFSLIYFEAIGISKAITPDIHLMLFCLIMIPLCITGYFLWKGKFEDWAFPLFDLAVIISLIATLVSLSQGYVWTTQSILVISAVLFMALSLTLKKDLYIYLTTLCLGLSAYNSLIATKDTFGIDLVVYIIYTLIFIGILFFLPIIKRILNFSFPRYMVRAINWKSAFFYGSFIFTMTLIFFFLYSLQLANFPGFCTKCHFMKPYADAWAHSTHKEVNCVGCHFEPGLRPLIKGKINGVVSVIKYMTHTYSIKPKSEISDTSCLRSGCHNKMDLNKEIGYKKGIYFNHMHHLKTLPRGKQLRCTTCHSQIVQGEHLTVTESICFTCHFIERNKEGIGIGRCMSCHESPIKPVVFQGIEFNHRSFMEGKSDTLCIDCHAGVTQGEGEVPTERCYSCHSEQNPDLSDPESLHFEHITKRKVECFECHLDIRHGLRDMSNQFRWDCKECHNSSHTVPEKMYIGIGAMEIAGKPDPMFTAKVSCRGCHKYKKTVQIGSLSFETTKADVKSCDDCHGMDSGYTDLAIEWQNEIREIMERVSALRKRLENPIKDMTFTKPTKITDEILQRFQRAEANFQFIQADGSYGVHNYPYSIDILASIEKDFNICLSSISETPVNLRFTKGNENTQREFSDE
ncbi:NapC/NirT family cytochrome c [bacterium]|nr:NapC/NirT family cytochrome c [bacterium]